MILKSVEILNMYDGLAKISENEFDVNTAYIIAKDIQELEISKSVIDKKRNSLISDFAERDDNNDIVVTEDKTAVRLRETDRDIFNKKIIELMNEEVDINLKKLSKKSLLNFKISPKDILCLIKIIEEE